MEHKIKMIGLDLDGTLLTDKKELTARTKAVISRALSRGIVVLVATGRPWMGIPEELRNFPGMRYALTSNGARVIDAQEEPGDRRASALARAGACRRWKPAVNMIPCRRSTLTDRGMRLLIRWPVVERYHRNPSMCEYMRNTRIPVDNIAELVKEENRGLDKVQALFADMGERTQAWTELREVGGLELVGSLKYNIEINAAGVNKGTGLVNLGKMLGIKRGEIMAFGDGDNDIVMLKEVGIGVAMANAEAKVKEAADYITMSNEEDGVAEAIEKMVLRV